MKITAKLLMEIEKIMVEYNTNYILDLFGKSDEETGMNILKFDKEVKQKARVGKYKVNCLMKGIPYKEKEFLEADFTEVENEYATFRNEISKY